MENFVSILIPLLQVCILLRLMLAPLHWMWKIFLNSCCGFLCLWLLNTISGFTGLHFPINIVTAAVAGFLGLPGIAILAILQWIL